ncbi:translation initiation factor 2 [Catellatospora sp. NPDC049609]|uniref:translation initiation factor 2 n=1 Tax=Catellatospora sp. NPDC049609 TaxID=3155505 RepID=UPI003414F158
MSRPGDEQWRRPDPDAGESDAARAAQAYPGPPQQIPPPPGWHPEVERRTTPPRRLPEVDHDALDLAEDRADRFTNLLGIVAGVVLILVACIQWRT